MAEGVTAPRIGDMGAHLPGDRSAVRIGALFLTAVYAAMTPANVLVLDGQARTVMVVLAAVSAVACAVIAYVATRVADRGARWLLGMIYAIPLANTEAHLAVTRQLEQTALIMLILVAIGATAVSRRALFVSLAGTLTAWVAIVLLRQPKPGDQVGHYALQLVLASALAVGLFIILSLIHI